MKIKSFKNLIFKKTDYCLEISGSLHKYFNEGLHNSNDFSVFHCIKLISEICNNFKINPNLCKVSSLEFGVNVVLQLPVTDVINWLRFYKTKQFAKTQTSLEYFLFAGSYYFGIKAYYKTIHFPIHCDGNVFRFEWKKRESKYLKEKGVFTFADLQKPSNYLLFSNILCTAWNDVLIFDKRTKKGAKYLNTDLWLDFRDKHHRNTFNLKREKYYKILGKNNLHNVIYLSLIHI